MLHAATEVPCKSCPPGEQLAQILGLISSILCASVPCLVAPKSQTAAFNPRSDSAPRSVSIQAVPTLCVCHFRSLQELTSASIFSLAPSLCNLEEPNLFFSARFCAFTRTSL